MDEFALIREYLAPLAQGFKGALQLTDDAALIDVPPGQELVVTVDAMADGIHFLGHEDPELIAKKLLRINLSDLAAMGATPMAYFLAAMLPRDTSPQWVKRFADGLREDQALFGIHLAGGDTVATRGPLSFSATALGTVPQGQALRRSGAREGDIIFVSGTLGDSALGLRLLTKNLSSHGDDKQKLFLEQRYLLPSPRLALGQQLLGIAHAAMDISDGLVQDLGHICKASGVGATIHRDALPLSDAAEALIKANDTLWECPLSGGDDYELLFTAPREKESLVKSIGADLDLPVTAIGEISEGSEVRVFGANKKSLALKRTGYKHF